MIDAGRKLEKYMHEDVETKKIEKELDDLTW
jgi:hypothetical protein